MTQDELVADVMAGFTEVGGVPSGFADFVQERIATRPSPVPQVDPNVLILAKLDEILDLLRGTSE